MANHEFVNVGFSTCRMVCKHCDQSQESADPTCPRGAVDFVSLVPTERELEFSDLIKKCQANDFHESLSPESSFSAWVSACMDRLNEIVRTAICLKTETKEERSRRVAKTNFY